MKRNIAMQIIGLTLSVILSVTTAMNHTVASVIYTDNDCESSNECIEEIADESDIIVENDSEEDNLTEDFILNNDEIIIQDENLTYESEDNEIEKSDKLEFVDNDNCTYSELVEEGLEPIIYADSNDDCVWNEVQNINASTSYTDEEAKHYAKKFTEYVKSNGSKLEYDITTFSKVNINYLDNYNGLQGDYLEFIYSEEESSIYYGTSVINFVYDVDNLNNVSPIYCKNKTCELDLVSVNDSFSTKTYDKTSLSFDGKYGCKEVLWALHHNSMFHENLKSKEQIQGLIEAAFATWDGYLRVFSGYRGEYGDIERLNLGNIGINYKEPLVEKTRIYGEEKLEYVHSLDLNIENMCKTFQSGEKFFKFNLDKSGITYIVIKKEFSNIIPINIYILDEKLNTVYAENNFTSNSTINISEELKEGTYYLKFKISETNGNDVLNYLIEIINDGRVPTPEPDPTPGPNPTPESDPIPGDDTSYGLQDAKYYLSKLVQYLKENNGRIITSKNNITTNISYKDNFNDVKGDYLLFWHEVTLEDNKGNKCVTMFVYDANNAINYSQLVWGLYIDNEISMTVESTNDSFNSRTFNNTKDLIYSSSKIMDKEYKNKILDLMSDAFIAWNNLLIKEGYDGKVGEVKYLNLANIGFFNYCKPITDIVEMDPEPEPSPSPEPDPTLSVYWGEKNISDAPMLKLNTNNKCGTAEYGTHYFKISLDNPGIVTISITNQTNDDKITANLYDGGDNNITISSYIPWNTIVGLNKGSYYIKLFDHSSNQQIENIDIKYEQTNYCERELNDDFSSATPLEIGKKSIGFKNKDNFDKEYYSFEGKANDKIRIFAENFDSSIGSMRLYAPDRNTYTYLSSRDMSWDAETESYYTKDAISLGASGTYYIEFSVKDKYSIMVSKVGVGATPTPTPSVKPDKENTYKEKKSKDSENITINVESKINEIIDKIVGPNPGVVIVGEPVNQSVQNVNITVPNTSTLQSNLYNFNTSINKNVAINKQTQNVILLSNKGTSIPILYMSESIVDEKTVKNQNILVSANANILGGIPVTVLNDRILAGRILSINENGSKVALTWAGLKNVVPGDIYAVCYNSYDKAYLLKGFVYPNGLVRFEDFILRDTTNITLFTLTKPVNVQTKTK